MNSPTVRIVTSFGSTIYVEQAVIKPSSMGDLVQGWWRFDGQLLPQEYGPHRLETCREWEVLS